MDNLPRIEETYKHYIQDLASWLPEDIIEVDLELLHRFDLLNYHSPKERDPALTRYFHVIETHEKITLINDDFVVWIVPDSMEGVPVTYTLIALNKPEGADLELAFSSTGIYNSSRLVLRVLEKFLLEIQENEEFLSKIE